MDLFRKKQVNIKSLKFNKRGHILSLHMHSNVSAMLGPHFLQVISELSAHGSEFPQVIQN